MGFDEMPIDWTALRFLPDESVWMNQSSWRQGYEIIISGKEDCPDQSSLDFAKRVMANREQLVDLSRSFLWEFVDRSKFPPAEENWYADSFRFELVNSFIIEFSHVADPYGLWTVELHESRLGEEESDSYGVQEFRRRNH